MTFFFFAYKAKVIGIITLLGAFLSNLKISLHCAVSMRVHLCAPDDRSEGKVLPSKAFSKSCFFQL